MSNLIVPSRASLCGVFASSMSQPGAIGLVELFTFSVDLGTAAALSISTAKGILRMQHQHLEVPSKSCTRFWTCTSREKGCEHESKRGALLAL